MLDSNSRLLRSLIISCLICFSFKTIPVHAQAPNFGWAAGFNCGGAPGTSKTAVDSSNNIHFVANFSGSIELGSITLSSTNWTRVLAKCDSQGNVLWAVPAGSQNNTVGLLGAVNSLAVDGSGNTFVAGAFQNTSTFGTITLTNPNPNVITAFIATFDSTGVATKAQVLLTNNSQVSAMTLDSLGNIYITGVFTGTAQFGVTNLESGDLINPTGFLAKYDTSGNVIWAEMLAGTVNAIGVDSTGNGYVTGYFESRSAAFGNIILTNAGISDIFLARFDNAGNWVWAKRGGGSQGGLSDESGSALSLDAAGNCYFAGIYYADAFTHKMTFDSVTLNGAAFGDIFIAKYDATGALLWVTNAVGQGTDIATGLSVDKSGNAYLAGFFLSGNLSMGNVTLTNSPGNGFNGLVAKYNTNGQLLWTKQILGTSAEALDIATDQYENAYVIGTSHSPTTFDGITIGTNTNQLWLAKIDGPRVSITSSGNQVIVSWPTNAVGLHLESATDLNANDWSPVPNAPVVAGTQNTVTVNASGNSQFFRLSGP